MPHAQGDGQIAEEEPDVAGEAVEHAAHEGLMIGQTGHLAVSGVAEVGQHQEHHATDVPPQLRVIEAPAGTCAEKHREDGDEIGGGSELDPHQGKGESDGAREVDIEPLLSVVRLERLVK